MSQEMDDAPAEAQAEEAVVLVVDDDEDLADTYSMWLEDEHDVRTAYGGHEAVEQITDDIDVVLLDRRMPNMPGDEVLDRIRGEGVDCLVSMLTAVKPSQDITDLPFDEYLTKPVSKSEVVAAVEELLLRDQMGEETKEYLAKKSTAETIEAEASEGTVDDEAMKGLVEEVEAAKTTDVQREAAELERLTRLNEIARAANRAVVDSSTQEELSRTICREFVDIQDYEHAVVGEYVENNDDFVVVDDSEEGLDLSTVNLTREGDTKNALDRQQVTVTRTSELPEGDVQELHDAVTDDEQFEAMLTIPIRYRGETRGGILLFTDDDFDLSERERSTLLEVGDSVGNAIDSLQTRELVDTDSVVELELEITDRDDVFVDLSAELECRVHIEGVHLDSDGGVVCYLKVSGAYSDDVTKLLAENEAVERYRVVDDSGDEVLVECSVRGSSIVTKTLESAAGITEFFTDEGVGHLGSQFAPGVDLRSILDGIRSDFDDVKLVSKRQTENSYQSVGRFRGSVEDQLTERQDEVIRTAFKAGYFDWPRDSTAEDLAEALNLAPSTLHEHLREAEHKLVESYLEETELTESLARTDGEP